MLIYKYISTSRDKELNEIAENERMPVIYYSEDDGPKRILLDKDNIFNTNIEITTEEDCSISVKKDGESVSKNTDSSVLSKEGTYEVTAKSKSGKKVTERTLEIDKTPPKVNITKNSSKSYTISFEDVSDIGTARIIKLDPSTGKTLKEIDLMQDGLKSSTEIKEKGVYSLEVTDNVGNLFVGNTEFEIE